MDSSSRGVDGGGDVTGRSNVCGGVMVIVVVMSVVEILMVVVNNIFFRFSAFHGSVRLGYDDNGEDDSGEDSTTKCCYANS